MVIDKSIHIVTFQIYLLRANNCLPIFVPSSSSPSEGCFPFLILETNGTPVGVALIDGPCVMNSNDWVLSHMHFRAFMTG
jgi:hypothetical protein